MALLFSVVSVYAPSTSEHRQPFFAQQLLPYIPQGRHLIVAGDFNCVADDLDVTPNAHGTRRTGYTGGLATVMHTFGLNDAWREQHPAASAVTHVCASSRTGARLDRFLVSTDVLLHTTHTDILEGLPGDHLGVSLRIVAPQGIQQGPRPWIFPPELIDDDIYSKELSDLIRHFLLDHPLTISFDHRARWDALKAEIRDHCSEFLRRSALRLNAMHRSLTERARTARVAFVLHPQDPTRYNILQEAQRDLSTYVSQRAQQASSRAGTLWQLYGEQSTYYFYHQAQQKRAQTSWSTVSDIPLDTFPDRARAGQVLSDFFSSDSPNGLFRPQPCDAEAQTELLQVVDKVLSPSDRQACEGVESISLDELTDSLHRMPRGKSPGSDGLTYEFYQQYWTELGPLLLGALREAFQDPIDTRLSESQRTGIITLLYKGSGPKSEPSSYRPLTLLNTDVKLLGRALSDRWLTSANRVIDDTQTAFLPQRWIGDNILAHLEMVEFAETQQAPGCLAFLDFSKAYDRLDRDWLGRTMQALGFGSNARRWVRLLHSDLFARVRYNNWLTSPFPVDNGLAQGSPLSPLLYILAAQPLAAHLRWMVAQGTLRPMAFPDRTPSPPCHQHADDLTLALASRTEVQKAVDGSIALFCRASGGKLNASKSKAMVIGSEPEFAGYDTSTGITYVQRGDCIRHLGVQLSTNPSCAIKQTFTALETSILTATRHWASRRLSYLGRLHVAKQAIASKLTFHVTFLPPPQDFLRRITSILAGFVANSSGTMRPSRIVYALPWEMGGTGFTTLGTATQSLQAKIISRLLEPECLPWKAFFVTHFPDDAQRYGTRWVFSTRRTHDLHIASTRARSYITNFRAVGIVRRSPSDELPTQDEEILSEPLFFNSSVRLDEEPLTPLGQIAGLASAGITCVGDLKNRRHEMQPSDFSTAVSALPEPWKPIVLAPPTPAPWLWDGDTAWHRSDNANGWESFRVSSNHRLLPLQLAGEPTISAKPAAVVPWDPGRTWRPGKKHASDMGLYVLGDIAPTSIFPASWEVGSMKCDEFVVRTASRVLSVSAAVKAKVLTSSDSSVRPPMWGPHSDNDANPETRWLRAISEHGASATANSQPSRTRTASQAGLLDYTAGQAWMSQPSRARPHWRDRLLEAQVGPIATLAPPSTTDMTVTETWTEVWKRIQGSDLNREQRHIGWQVLHNTLPCGALSAYRAIVSARSHTTPNAAIDDAITAADCPFCEECPQTITHMLFDCPIANSIWIWALALWSYASGHASPSPNPGLMLLDDQRDWAPPRDAAHLWTTIRLIVISGLYHAAAQKRRGLPVTGFMPAAYTIHHLKTALLQDWHRVLQPNAAQGVISGLAKNLCCTSWLRGRSPAISPQAFLRRWGSLVCVHNGRMDCSLSLQHPVGFPHNSLE